MEKYEVICLNIAENSESKFIIYADEYECSDNIVLSLELDDEHICESGEYYFETFKKFKDELLKKGYGLKCCGSMKNAIQSTMAGYSDKIYLVTLGKPALKENLVSMFDFADISEFYMSDEQDEFFEIWNKSLTES